MEQVKSTAEVQTFKLGKDIDLQERVRLKKAVRAELYSLTPPFPKTNFLIELSNSCNHRCLFCAHQKMTRKPHNIKKETALRILREAYELGTREVGFYATGEPFLTKDLPDYIAAAKQIGYSYVYLTSNGSLVTPEKIRAVIDAGLDSLKFSINAPNREMYQFIHGKDHFDQVLEHLKYLHEYRQQCGRDFKIYVTGILCRFTEGLQEDYRQIFGGLCDQIVFKYVYNQGGYMPEIDPLLRCECDKEQRRQCNLPFDAISVTAEGYLSVENADYDNLLIVADLNEVSLKEGWYGPKMQEMRRRFMEDDLGGTLCDGCVHHECRKASALLPKYSELKGDYPFSAQLVEERIKAAGFKVFVPLLRSGKLSPALSAQEETRILKTAALYGQVTVGLWDEQSQAGQAQEADSYGEERARALKSLPGVQEVILVKPNGLIDCVKQLAPDFVLLSSQWQSAALASYKRQLIEIVKNMRGGGDRWFSSNDHTFSGYESSSQDSHTRRAHASSEEMRSQESCSLNLMPSGSIAA